MERRRQNPENYDVEAQQYQHSRSRHRRSHSQPPLDYKSSGWISVEEAIGEGETSMKDSPRARRHHRRSRGERSKRDEEGNIDCRALMLGFLHRGRGILDLDRLRWAKQSIDVGTRQSMFRAQEQAREQLRKEEIALLELEDGLNERKHRSDRSGNGSTYIPRLSEVEEQTRQREDHDWDAVVAAQVREDWRRSVEDQMRWEEDTEWDAWLQQEKLVPGADFIKVRFRGESPPPLAPPMGNRTSRSQHRRSLPHHDEPRARSISPPYPDRRTGQNRMSDSFSRAFEVRLKQLNRRKAEDARRREENERRSVAEQNHAREQLRRDRVDAQLKLQQKQDKARWREDIALRAELGQKWARVQASWQRLMLGREDCTAENGPHGDSPTENFSAAESSAVVKVSSSSDDGPGAAIALMDRHGGDRTEGRIALALPQHTKPDIFAGEYLWHETSEGVPKHTDKWLVDRIKEFYKRDVKRERGMGLHVLNTVSFAKFVRFERRKNEAKRPDDEFSRVLDHWTCTAQQFFTPLKDSSEYGKFRWILNHREEDGIEWMTKLETLMKQVRPEHDVIVVIYLYESLDYATAAIVATIIIILGIAATLIYGILKRDIRTAMELGGGMAGLLTVVGGASGWANQFGRESPATPVGASYAYDTTCRVECVEDDGKR